MYETLVGTSPFLGDDSVKTYNIILKGFEGVGFPNEVGRNAQALIRKLCRIAPNERIGYAKRSFSEIQKNKWFENFNWLHLRNMVMNPPKIPNIQDGTEGYDDYDEFPRDDEIPADETSGWDKEF
uniref:cGMP-dependent protein kinase 1 (Trinotate prediction) n=1 Tax=Myxobolus squamalis TaxID=59785 RepID=A0A6B2FZR0_MYXSQ